jgi:hypothetical protein
MRKASTLVGLTLIALGAAARAEVPAAPVPAPPVAAPAPAPVDVAVAPAPAPAAVGRARRIELGLAFLPMAFGKITSPFGTKEITGGASFAYGGSFALSYRVFAGLSLGFAPQAIFNVQYKVYPSQLMAPGAATEYDLLARVGYTIPIVESVAVYAELLPGYSIIALQGASPAKGLMLAMGGGVAMDMTDRVFANIGAGYQVGFQSVSQMGMTLDNNSRYLRVALGGGVRF